MFDSSQYGLGASYEQGQLPRLRIAFELYTPLPELHTVVLDLCDNTTSSEVKYDLTMKYGPTKQVRLSLETEVDRLWFSVSCAIFREKDFEVFFLVFIMLLFVYY